MHTIRKLLISLLFIVFLLSSLNIQQTTADDGLYPYNDISFQLIKNPTGEQGATTTTTFYSIIDSYVASTSPTSNYGTETKMYVGNHTNGNQNVAVMRFNLTSLPDNAIVTNVIFRLYCSVKNAPTVQKRLTASRMSSTTWTETGVTWNNYGGFSTTNQTYVDRYVDTIGWYNWTVTNMVQYCLDNTEEYVNICMRYAIGVNAYEDEWHSRENTNDPQLVVTYHVPEWYAVETWYSTLQTSSWHTSETWLATVTGKSWSLVEVWYSSILAKTFHFVESWNTFIRGISFTFVEVWKSVPGYSSTPLINTFGYIGFILLFISLPTIAFGGKKGFSLRHSENKTHLTILIVGLIMLALALLVLFIFSVMIYETWI
jgi:hypothetical protein